ncbi:hypothetical protein [Bradyrhizobium sp. dw_78]|uniref:hypothetical protein n=1 Tax=Bradyrhizobium sp. dw_78 TaxID=2719793 RepID=UPI001BD46FD0|nr:hypothetical protein [Bradyrhizobium sp. dw_78]
MRKTILTILGTVLITASAVQMAAATERHHVRKPVSTAAQANQSFRDSNAAIWTRPQAESDGARYQNSAGAGAVAH